LLLLSVQPVIFAVSPLVTPVNVIPLKLYLNVFPVVFVIGLVEGILPSKKGDIEEERRIAFVGISRAMKLLYLSTCQTYLGSPCKRSIFVDEILDSGNGNNSS